jgi:hypothetical protein
MALLRLANKVASESKGLYADAKLKGCKGLETPLLNHFLDTEHLLVKLAEREAFKVVRHAKADLDKMLNAGAISAEKHAREVARLA